ncbi:hypothetical protein V2A60_002816 [Cordyceps javanica]|uniref:Cell wall protein n=1 Tax=Cordyceps javanica TaxID=43265 RepID=A0A545UXC6_9HYPO|nr:hypothetical protein IF1G_07001 [Cordyceps javanica]TQW05998.1 hypothetical protein IF2G_06281 [Cordyceps javanica]
MKASLLITAVAAGLASAAVERRSCPAMVDTALKASVVALQGALGSSAPANLKDATDAGGACFKKAIGCPVTDAPPPAAPAAPIDCSGMIDTGLKTAVGALKKGLGLFAPPEFQTGVDAGLACFKETLGCTAPAAAPAAAPPA